MVTSPMRRMATPLAMVVPILSNSCTDHGVQRGNGRAKYHTEVEVGGLDRHLDLIPPQPEGVPA